MADPTIRHDGAGGEQTLDRDVRRAERMAALIRGIFIPVLLVVVALAVGGLLLAPQGRSTLGLMRALVFQCH